jgi:exodeoxyribonuclease V beta subunit
MRSFSELALLESPFEPGLTVIEASAGTGKTYSISHLVPRLLLQGVLPDLSKLLLVTFTNDAARELAERVRRVLTRLATPPACDEATRHPHVAALRPLLADEAAQTRLDRALLDLDLLAVSTIHAFCQRTLQQEGSLCGLPVLPEVTTNDEEHLAPIVRSLWVAQLSTDATAAALATALDWKFAGALQLINTLRRAQNPHTEPAVQPYATLRAKIDTLCAALTADESFQSVAKLIGKVTAWNKGIENAEDALARLRPLQAGALHTLAYWQNMAFAAGVPAKITSRTAAAKALKAELQGHPWFVALDQLTTLTTRLEWAWQQQLAAEALPQLVTVMAHRRLITQDGLIGALYRALHRKTPEGAEQSARLAAHLAERYHVALIDESQDTDPRQLAIFQRIFNHAAHPRRLILVGDPKQAIYSFRGADLSTYLAARNTADAGYTLTHTHRAPQPLVTTVNGLFQRALGFHHPDMMFVSAVSALTYDQQLFRLGRPCSRLEAWIVPDVDLDSYSAQARRIPALSARVASTIVDLLHHGELRTTYRDDRPSEIRRVSPRDCAVLVATHIQAQAMAEALQALAVPVVINSGSDIFSSEEALELHTLLHALLDPRRTRRLRSALATRLVGLDATALAALDQLGNDGQQPSVVWRERFEGWNKTWMNRGLTALFAALEGPEVGITRRLALVPLTGERRATNYRHLTDLLLEAAREAAPRPDEIVRWLGQQIARTEERSQNEERQLQLSSDREAVQIVTMHKAKGLEYPLVFCPYLADPLKPNKGVARLPASRANGSDHESDLLINLDLVDDTLKAERTRELMAAQLEERLRLTYVALTRAQVRVWICSYSNSARSDEGSPLDWMLRTDSDLAAYPTYSDDWVESVKTGRSARHCAVLQSLGAQPHVEGVTDEPAPLITFRDPPLPSTTRYAPAVQTSEAIPDLVALPSPVVPPSWRITSFSTLTKEKHAHGGPMLAGPLPVETALAADTPAIAFLSSPGGAAVGTVVHDWIETWDLSPPGAEALARHLKTTRPPEPRADQPSWPDALHELFATLRLIRLPGCGDTPLHELCPEPHGSEWHFHLPLAGALTVGALARCFEEHADPTHRPYAASLAALSDEKFQGLLQGYIDRLARQGPAWGVIDWKTNRLGATLSDYDQAALLRCAMQDHYLLQTHLYLVALRRYLRALGLVDHHLAGAWLVFLRAIAPGETRGVLHIDPPAAMLDALDRLFAPALRPLV